MTYRFTSEELIKALEKREIQAETREIYKNGVPLTAICICSGARLSPTYYTELLQDRFADADDAADFIVSNLSVLPALPSAITPELFDDVGCLLENVYIGLAPEVNSEAPTRPGPFPETVQFLYMRILMEENGGYSMRIQAAHLERLGISEEEAWQQAEENTFAEGETLIIRLEDVVRKYNDEEAPISNGPDAFIVTNRYKTKGAAAVLDRKQLENFFREHAPDCIKLVAIPSSIHEAIIIPTTEEYAEAVLERCNELVAIVNDDCVSPVDRLGDKCCILW